MQQTGANFLCIPPKYKCWRSLQSTPTLCHTDANNSPAARRLSTVNVQSLSIQLKLLLVNKPQKKYMDEMRDDMRRLLNQLEATREKFELDLKAIQKPTLGDIPGEI